MQLNYILSDFILISFSFIQYLAFSTLAGQGRIQKPSANYLFN
jgi:hypothetical protein